MSSAVGAGHPQPVQPRHLDTAPHPTHARSEKHEGCRLSIVIYPHVHSAHPVSQLTIQEGRWFLLAASADSSNLTAIIQRPSLHSSSAQACRHKRRTKRTHTHTHAREGGGHGPASVGSRIASWRENMRLCSRTVTDLQPLLLTEVVPIRLHHRQPHALRLPQHCRAHKARAGGRTKSMSGFSATAAQAALLEDSHAGWAQTVGWHHVPPCAGPGRPAHCPPAPPCAPRRRMLACAGASARQPA